ncbi:MAG TPA: serine hydrolase [Candidatus Saccharimonadales bacterium]
MSKVIKFLIFCGAIVAVVLFMTFRNHSSVDQNQMTYSVDDKALSTSIEKIMKDNPRINMSVSIFDLQTHRRYHYGETASFDVASVGKLVTATTLLIRIEANQLSLNDKLDGVPISELLRRMIVESDNDAWLKLNTRVLTHDELNYTAYQLGLTSYQSSSNTVTSDDIALLLAKIAQQKLFDSEHTDLLLSLMRQADMRNFIVKATPEGAEIYHKGGYLADRVHDASIIHKGDRSYVLVIFSKARSGSYDYQKGSQIFAAITDATADAFFTE